MGIDGTRLGPGPWAPRGRRPISGDVDTASLQHVLETAQPYLSQYGYAAIFLGVMLEDFGVPLPGETLLLAGAFSASRGQMSFALVMLLAWAGAVVGDNVGYALGRFGGRRLVLRYGRYVRITGERLDRVDRFFARWGGLVVVVARFVELLRQLNGLVAGIGRMSWPRFLAYNALGAALWVGFWGSAAYFFGSHLGVVLAFLDAHRTAFLAGGGGLVLVLVAAWAWRRRRRHRQG